MDPTAVIETLPGVIGVTDIDTALLVSVRVAYDVDEDTGEVAGYDASTRRLERLVADALPGWAIEKHRSRADARPQTEVWLCRATGEVALGAP